MTHIQIWIESPVALAMAKTLLHSLWQATLAAFALAMCLRLTRSARVRYAAALAALIVIIPVSTVTFMVVKPKAKTVRHLKQGPAPAITAGGPDAVIGPGGEPRPSFLQTALRWITPVWFLGFLVFNLRQIVCWAAATRMRKRGVCLAPDVWQQRLTVLRRRMTIARPVLLLESCMAQVPLVVGHLRPAILVPLGLLAGLPAEQVELLLMHELAHIRRCDYVINMVQSFLESVMFYNPCVWWISNVIRTEREHCCDDLAIVSANNGVALAAALTALEVRRAPYAELAMTATGGTLVKRVRRLLGQSEPAPSVMIPLTGAALVVLVVSGFLLARPVPRPLPAHEAPLTGAIFAAPLAPPASGTATRRVQQNIQPAAATSALQASDQRWLDQGVVYIITATERATFLGLSSDDQRGQFIEQFWARRDPTPGTPENEFKDEHYLRVAYANQHFQSLLPPPAGMGWRTDRGRTYIQFGPPDEIESHGQTVRPDGTTQAFASETWLYRYIQGIGNDVIVEFADANGTGEFPRTMDPREIGDKLGRILATLPRPEGEQIFVTGHVGVPGSYLLRGQDRTLLHALTAAQGVTSETASAGAPIIIVRFKDSRNGELIKIDLNRLVSGADLDIPLQPGDVVVVP